MKTSTRWVLGLLVLAALCAHLSIAHGDHDDHDHEDEEFMGDPNAGRGDYDDEEFNADSGEDYGAGAGDGASAEAKNEAEEAKPVEIPDYVEPTGVKAHFYELFQDDGWSTRWVITSDSKFSGRFAVKTPEDAKIPKGDQHLVLLDRARHHGISHALETPFRPVNGEIVVQYEVIFVHTLDCGGAYMKLLIEDEKFSSSTFSNASPYVIMFGPDKCGDSSKVHFIFRHQNPVTGEWEEKHLTNPPKVKNDLRSHLYTLHVKPDNSFDVYIDLERVRSGSLLSDFQPSVNPQAEIPDPADKKPSDWVDEAEIPDESASKPEDWDEDAPAKILDESATKPEEWLDDEPLEIFDPEAEKPNDWDDDLDGEWEAPKVPNPRCEKGNCGEWTRPTIPNPAYKGKWVRPMIPNPAYKGEWKARLIPNPNYFEDKTPNNFPSIGAIGFEIWTMTQDITFDNIFLGHSIAEARSFAEQTFKIKESIQGPSKSSSTSASGQDFMNSLKESADKITEYAKANPVPFGVLVVAFIFPWILLFSRGGDKADKTDKEDKATKKSSPTSEASTSDSTTQAHAEQ